MKQLVSYLSVAAMILVACACNKQDQPDEASGKMSDLQYLIDGLVRTDDAGNITGYMIGDCLNEANPWEISVPVNNYEEAASPSSIRRRTRWFLTRTWRPCMRCGIRRAGIILLICSPRPQRTTIRLPASNS